MNRIQKAILYIRELAADKGGNWEKIESMSDNDISFCINETMTRKELVFAIEGALN